MLPLRLAPVVALVLVAPAAAAPTLEPLQPCYVSARLGGGKFRTEPVAYSGTGFDANAHVTVSVRGVARTTEVVADAAGAISGTVYAPGVRRGQTGFDVTATQQDDPTRTASVTSLVTDLTARLQPRTARPTQGVRFSGRGFTDTTAPIYAHYYLHDRLKRTVRLTGPPTTACGTFAVRRPQFPFRPAPGHWTIRIDQSPKSGSATPAVAIDVRIRRVVV